MKRLITIILIMLPMALHAQIPAIEQLGKEAQRHKGVEYDSVGSFMLGMAARFADKEQRKTFEMLDHIDMIICNNSSYASTLESRILSIIDSVGASFLASNDDNKGHNDVYAVKRGTVIKHLVIITKSDSDALAISAMSGTIPESRLAEISRLSPP